MDASRGNYQAGKVPQSQNAASRPFFDVPAQKIMRDLAGRWALLITMIRLVMIKRGSQYEESPVQQCRSSSIFSS